MQCFISYTLAVAAGLLLTAGTPRAAEVPVLTNLWHFETRSSSDSSPAVAPDGTIYFGTFDGKLWALTPEGNPKWRFQVRSEIFSSPAVGPDGTVYFGSRDRRFYALNPQGKLKWSFKTGGWVDSSPGIAPDGSIVVGSWDKKIHAFRPDGSQKWTYATEGEVVGSPVIDAEGTVYVGSHDRRFHAISNEGQKRWTFSTGNSIISSAALDGDGTIYFTSVDGFFYALNPEGTLKWKLQTTGITESSPVIGQDGRIYVGVNEFLWAISREGKEIWRRAEHLPVLASPIAWENGEVSFISRYGLVVTLDAEKRFTSQYYMYQYGAAAPGYSAGTMYVPGFWTNFVALPMTNLATSSWPKGRGDAQNTGRPARLSR